MKIVRENYLRDDVWCGIIDCQLCPQTAAVLNAKTTSSSSKFHFSHFLVPDTNIALHQVIFKLLMVNGQSLKHEYTGYQS